VPRVVLSARHLERHRGSGCAVPPAAGTVSPTCRGFMPWAAWQKGARHRFANLAPTGEDPRTRRASPCANRSKFVP